MKRLLARILVKSTVSKALLATLIISFLASGIASAATFTGQWVDSDTIIIGSPTGKHATYSKDGTGNYDYLPAAPSDFSIKGSTICPNTIVVNAASNPGTGTITLDHWVKVNVGKTFQYECEPEYGGKPQPITLTDTANAATPPGAQSNGTGDLECAQSNALNWLICPVVSGLDDLINAADAQITSQLAIGTTGNSDQPNTIFADSNNQCANGSTSCASYYKAWASFRDIALGLMAIAGLVIVVAQALGAEVLDAYTIRKALPRLLIAAIAISLSWPLMEFAVTLANDLGFGIRDLIEAPFNQPQLTISNAGTALIAVFGFGAVAVIGAFGLLSFALTGALAVVVALLVLIIRQVVITLLIILAPIALVAYILPNTQRAFRLWWDNFLKALLMFPLIVAFIAAGHVFASIALSQSHDLINQIIGFTAYFAPYFMIPLTFRMAGGIMGGLGGFVNARGQPLRQGLSQFRRNRSQQRMRNAGERLQSGNVFRGAGSKNEKSKRYKVNQALQSAALLGTGKAGINPAGMRGRLESARQEVDFAAGLKALEEGPAAQLLSGDDDTAQAILYGKGSRAKEMEYLRKKGFSEATIKDKMGSIDRFRKPLGQSALMQAAFLNTSKASTAWNDDPMGVGGNASSRMLADLESASGGNAQLRAQLAARVKQNGQQNGRMDLNAPFADTYKAAEEVGQIMGATQLSREQVSAAADHLSRVYEKDEKGNIVMDATGNPKLKYTQDQIRGIMSNLSNPNNLQIAKQGVVGSVGDRMQEQVLYVEGPGAMVGGKGSAAENLAPAEQRRLMKSARSIKVQQQRFEQYQQQHTDMFTDPSLTPEQQLSGVIEVDDGTGTGAKIKMTGAQIQQGLSEAQDKLVQEVAGVRAVHSVLGQVSREKQAVVTQNILQKPGLLKDAGFDGTVLDYIGTLQNNKLFFASTNDFLSTVGRSGGMSPEEIEALRRAQTEGGMAPPIQPLDN